MHPVTHSCKFCLWRSWPLVSNMKQQLSVMHSQHLSLRRYGLVQHCCTIANQLKQPNDNESGIAEELSKTENKRVPVARYTKEIKAVNDTSLHISRQLKINNSVDSESGDYICKFSKDCDNKEPVTNRALTELEVELLRQEGYEVPDIITPLQWDELLDRPHLPARINYLRYLYLSQKKKEERLKERELAKIESERIENLHQCENRLFHENGHIRYEMGCNTIFLEMERFTMNQFNHGRVFSAMMFGQPFVIDAGFEAHMDNREKQRCAKQIMDAIGINRTHPDPFYLHICNGDRQADTMQRLERLIPSMHKPEYPLSVHPENYLDCFPKEKIVYITPHCKEVMTTFDHDAVYVIGGIVKYGAHDQADYFKARSEGIKMQKLPLERYLSWNTGSKPLSISRVLGILLDLKHTDDWHKSLLRVPSYKIKTFENSQARLENDIRTKRLRTKAPELYDRVTSARIKNLYEE